MLLAGEASGDRYAGALAREIKALEPAAQLEGVGSTWLRQQDVRLIADSTSWGAIGALHAASKVPRVLRAVSGIRRAMAAGKPGLFIPIDFGFVNVRMARWAKARGWRVLYFVPPGSWRRDRQGSALPEIADAVSTPFPWSAEMLQSAGVPAHWFGHPLKQLIAESGSAQVRGNGLAVLPGSRAHEIKTLLPVLAQALGDAPPIEFALAPSVDRDRFARDWAARCPHRAQDLFIVGDSYGVLGRARAAVVCSGTATLEAALCGCPMVVVYRLPRLTEWEAALLRLPRPKFVALPNILLDRAVVPELLQEALTPDSVLRALRPLMAESPERAAQLGAFREIDDVTGPSDAISRTAALACEIAIP
jgi:lipid-A-disaccharide synthase